jgi:hypothetical protein
MNSFDTWLNEQSTSDQPDEGYVEKCNGSAGVPVTPDNFNGCISYWAQSVGESSVLSWNGVVEIMILPWSSRVRYDSFYQVLRDEYNLIEDWMLLQNAPTGVNQAFFSSYDFWWYDTNQQMLNAAYSSAAIALAASAAVILLSTRSVILMLFSTITIGFVLTRSVNVVVVVVLENCDSHDSI